MTKSPVALAKVAFQTAKDSLPAYSHPFSPRLFTQHQLFAILVLRQFLKTDYRGIIQMLKDFSDLRKVLDLKPGYDSEFNHEFCRDKLNIRSTIIAYNPRRTTKLPSAKYRREMSTEFERLAYGQRWQVESVFSRHKRLLGSALRNRNAESRKRECLLRVLTHNLMIIRRAA